jgi:hypothetical protein
MLTYSEFVSEAIDDNPKAPAAHEKLLALGHRHTGLRDGQYSRYSGGHESVSRNHDAIVASGYRHVKNGPGFAHYVKDGSYSEHKLTIEHDHGKVKSIQYQHWRDRS